MSSLAAWNAAVAIDPTAGTACRETRIVRFRGSAFQILLKGAGLTDIEVTDLIMPCQFSSFDDYWLRSHRMARPFGAIWRDFRKITVQRCASDCGKIFSATAPMDHLRFRPRRGR